MLIVALTASHNILLSVTPASAGTPQQSLLDAQNIAILTNAVNTILTVAENNVKQYRLTPAILIDFTNDHDRDNVWIDSLTSDHDRLST